MPTQQFDWKEGYLAQRVLDEQSGKEIRIPPHEPHYRWKEGFPTPFVISQSAYDAAVAEVSERLADYTPRAAQRHAQEGDHRPHLGRDAFQFVAGQLAIRREGVDHAVRHRCELHIASAFQSIQRDLSPYSAGAASLFPLALAFSEFVLVDEASRLVDIVLEPDANTALEGLWMACSDHHTVQDLAQRSPFIEAFERQKLLQSEAVTIVLAHKHAATPQPLYRLGTPREGIFPDVVTDAWRYLVAYRERVKGEPSVLF